MFKLQKGGNYTGIFCVKDDGDGSHLGVLSDLVWAPPQTSPLEKLAGRVDWEIDTDGSITIMVDETVEGFESLNWADYLEAEFNHFQESGIVDVEGRAWILTSKPIDDLEEEFKEFTESVDGALAKFKGGVGSDMQPIAQREKQTSLPEAQHNKEYDTDWVKKEFQRAMSDPKTRKEFEHVAMEHAANSTKKVKQGMSQLASIMEKSKEKHFGGPEPPKVKGYLNLMASIPCVNAKTKQTFNLDIFQNEQNSLFTVVDTVSGQTKERLEVEEVFRLIEDTIRFGLS